MSDSNFLPNFDELKQTIFFNKNTSHSAIHFHFVRLQLWQQLLELRQDFTAMEFNRLPHRRRMDP